MGLNWLIFSRALHDGFQWTVDNLLIGIAGIRFAFVGMIHYLSAMFNGFVASLAAGLLHLLNIYNSIAPFFGLGKISTAGVTNLMNTSFNQAAVSVNDLAFEMQNLHALIAQSQIDTAANIAETKRLIATYEAETFYYNTKQSIMRSY
jgi:hypothetical protein